MPQKEWLQKNKIYCENCNTTNKQLYMCFECSQPFCLDCLSEWYQGCEENCIKNGILCDKTIQHTFLGMICEVCKD